MAKGNIDPKNPEERVFFTVDWSKVSGAQDAQITFNATAKGKSPLVQTVGFTANNTVVPSDFKGALNLFA